MDALRLSINRKSLLNFLIKKAFNCVMDMAIGYVGKVASFALLNPLLG